MPAGQGKQPRTQVSRYHIVQLLSPRIFDGTAFGGMATGRPCFCPVPDITKVGENLLDHRIFIDLSYSGDVDSHHRGVVMAADQLRGLS
jgi:hypothetical protein